jgi:hypothetical protein
MSFANNVILCSLMLACCSFLIVSTAHAFTADSLDITVDKNGDAIATFRFTLEGILENAIPLSVLEEELTKGLTTSSEPPELKSMDRSSAVLLLKKFADTSDVPTGTEYRTATMDFKKAEIALQNSALSNVVSADFSPEKIVLTFPDSYRKEFTNVDVLPAVFHTVIDPAKIVPTQAQPVTQATTVTNGAMNITSSPPNVKVYVGSRYLGDSPAVFQDIPAGTHTVVFQKEGFEPASKTVTIIAGKTTNILVVLKYVPPAITEETPSFPLLPLLVVIIGLVAIVIGGYYYVSEKKKESWSVIKDTEAKGPRDPGPAPAGNGTAPEDTKPGDSEPRNTVVKVTMLKDIPDNEAGDNGKKDTHE